jgi:hypothetical protein
MIAEIQVRRAGRLDSCVVQSVEAAFAPLIEQHAGAIRGMGVTVDLPDDSSNQRCCRCRVQLGLDGCPELGVIQEHPDPTEPLRTTAASRTSVA